MEFGGEFFICDFCGNVIVELLLSVDDVLFCDFDLLMIVESEVKCFFFVD